MLPNQPSDRPAAIVIGLDSMQGIQTARILHRHGVPVYAIAADRQHHCCRTNSCRQILFADTGTEAVIETLRGLGAELPQKAVLFPCQDKSVRVLSRHRKRVLDMFHLALPPEDVVDMLMDKTAFHAHALAAGLPVPAAFVLETRVDAERAAERMTYPCILKPAFRSAGWDERPRGRGFASIHPKNSSSTTTSPADGPARSSHNSGSKETTRTCIRATATSASTANPSSHSSPGNCASGRRRRGRVAWARKCATIPCSARRWRCSAACPITVWATLEMKRDAQTGDYFIIEPNIGRPTGRSAIAEAGGVALLYTMYCDVLGLPLPDNRTQQFTGTKWIDLRHDFQSAYSLLAQGETQPAQLARILEGTQGPRHLLLA